MIIGVSIPYEFLDPLYGIKNEDGFRKYVDEWESDIVDILGPAFDRFPEGPPHFKFYMIPPAAGPDTEIIFELAKHFDAVVQSIDAYIGLGALLDRVAETTRITTKRNSGTLPTIS